MIPFYNQSREELFTELVCDETGLTQSEVLERHQRYGPNCLRETPPPSPLWLFIDQFKSFIIYILLFSVVFALAIGEYVDSLIIIVIVLLNALIGFFQEYSAARSLAALKKMTEVTATALRDGVWQSIKSTSLVPGDIISLVAGDKIPADARIIASNHFLVEEAALTGESLPVEKESSVIAGFLQIADQKNMLFSSTSVVRGRAQAVVVATGMQTEIGAIADMVETAKEELTPLQRRLDRFGRRLGLVIIVICVLVMILSCGKEFLLLQTISRDSLVAFAFIAISLAVAAVPTALPAVVTIALSIGVKRLLRRKALVRRLASVEALGSCDVICTDKTGTLTCNQMTVRRAWTFIQELSLEADLTHEMLSPVEKLLFLAGAVCNDAVFKREGSDIENRGDPTEIALLVSAEKVGCHHYGRRLDEIPFDGLRKRMSVLMEEEGGVRLYVKGAPDAILDISTRVLLNGDVVPLNDRLRDLIIAQNDLYAGQAMRVLAFSCSDLDGERTDGSVAERDLIFIGLQAMVDPPRSDVRQSIIKAYAAGIRVIMITGDYRETARAIGKEIGIEGEVLSGMEMADLNDGELCERLQNGTNIFARVIPEHKQRIVTTLQGLGHTVAMTGDGVNDAPALKKANIGIAVGSGTDVAKEAADFVLLDDSFSHIINAIEEGRGIYDNIQKSIMLLLSGNLGEVLIIFLAVMSGWNLPLTAVMLLWINMVTDGAPALAFSVDGYGHNIMCRPPKPRDEAIITGRKLILIAVLGVAGTVIALTVFRLTGGSSLLESEVTKARTMVFNFVVLYEMILVFIIRNEYDVPFFSNAWVWSSVILSIALQGVLMYTPMAFYFKLAPLDFFDIIKLLFGGLAFYLISLFCQIGKKTFVVN